MSPYNMEIEIDTVGYDQYQLNFSWQINEPEPGCVQWGDGVLFSGIGFACTGKFCVAARWDSGQLSEYDGFRLTKIRACLNDDGYDSLRFNVCTGEDGNNHIYTSDYVQFLPVNGIWFEHTLDTALYLNSDLEYWVGYGARIYGMGVFPLGTDNGPAKPGYGDKLRSCDKSSWDNLSDFGLDYNWTLQFYVEDTSGNELPVSRMQSPEEAQNISLSGYNLYQSIDDGEFELIEFIPYEPGDTSHSILFDAQPKLSCYQLRAVWTSPLDTCISAGALSKENPEERFICVLLTDVDEFGNKAVNPVKCYPNPFTYSTTFEFELEQVSKIKINIFNHQGEQVETLQQMFGSGKQQLNWHPNKLPVGIYYFTFQSGEDISSGKLVLIR